MNFTQIPTDTFEQIQLNAGVLLSSFDPKTGTLDADDIIGATSGGVNFTDTPSFKDYGDDIDNCPKNTKELKKIDGREVKIAGKFITVTYNLAKSLAGAADITDVKDSDSSDATTVAKKIKPRDELDADNDFKGLWWVGDYTGSTGGFIAIHMINVLNTSGFKLQSGDKSKGGFDFEYTAHYSIDAQDTVPYEIYISETA